MRSGELALPPLEVEVRESDGRIEVRDRDQRFAYELHFRPADGRWGGIGWVEFCAQPDGSVATVAATTSEVMAVVGDAGRAEDAAAITRAVALWFESAGHPRADRIAAYLRAGVEKGYGGERISLRALQARITERQVEGETLVDLCERGGFMLKNGRPDTSWLQRRAGFKPVRCSYTGRWRWARTATYPVFCALVRAVDDDPTDYGV